MRKGIAIVATAAFTMIGSAALAHVLDPGVDKPTKDLAKLRADIGKQVAKYTFCLVKAATKCEQKGANSGVECHLDTGVVDSDMPVGDATAKFQAAIAKCDDKLNLTKKGTDYVGIGCPGDCDAGTPGTQECADIPAFEASVESTATASSAKVQLGTLAAGIDLACSLDLGGVNTDQARIACGADNAKLLSKYSQGVFKCQTKCETDVKDKKGNGGLGNGNECVAGASADMNFNDCVAKAASKTLPNLSPTVSALVVPPLVNAINSATTGLYDRFDPTSTADASPCGNCGNATREGAEECDGADDAACPGTCNSDCTCP